MPGIYALSIVKRNAAGSLISQTVEYTAFSYSDEYAGFADVGVCASFLAGLAEDAGGRVMFPTDEFFGVNAESVARDFDPKTLFLSLSIALFLLDIVFRKFKFKRPR
jgi:hypothetical protein